MFWANGQSWNMFVRETSRTGPWTQLWSWRGWNQAVSSGMKKLFQSDHTLLRWTLQYFYLQSWSKLFRIGIRVDQQSSSGPSLNLQPRTWVKCLLNVSPSPLSRTLYSTMSLISFPSRVKINKLPDSHRIHPSRVSCDPSRHVIGIVSECNKKRKLNKKEN